MKSPYRADLFRKFRIHLLPFPGHGPRTPAFHCGRFSWAGSICKPIAYDETRFRHIYIPLSFGGRAGWNRTNAVGVKAQYLNRLATALSFVRTRLSPHCANSNRLMVHLDFASVPVTIDKLPEQSTLPRYSRLRPWCASFRPIARPCSVTCRYPQVSLV